MGIKVLDLRCSICIKVLEVNGNLPDKSSQSYFPRCLKTEHQWSSLPHGSLLVYHGFRAPPLHLEPVLRGHTRDVEFTRIGALYMTSTLLIKRVISVVSEYPVYALHRFRRRLASGDWRRRRLEAREAGYKVVLGTTWYTTYVTQMQVHIFWSICVPCEGANRRRDGGVFETRRLWGRLHVTGLQFWGRDQHSNLRSQLWNSDNFLISVPAPHFIVHGRPEILLGPVKVGGGAVGASGGQAGQPVGGACGAEVVVVQGHRERCLPTYRMLGSHADVAGIATRLAPSHSSSTVSRHSYMFIVVVVGIIMSLRHICKKCYPIIQLISHEKRTLLHEYCSTVVWYSIYCSTIINSAPVLCFMVQLIHY